MKLLKEKELIWSSIVANNRMNRKRKLVGVNSYEKEIGFNIIEFLTKRIINQEKVRWIDLCCGEGNALIEASQKFEEQGIKEIELIGIDLVDMFESHEPKDFLEFKVSSLQSWKPEVQYDLITCIHGLHYLGDKLELISKAIGALKEHGQFIGNIDFENIKDSSGKTLKAYLLKKLKEFGITYHSRKRLLTCTDHKSVHFGLEYIGANDKAGKNYTGQEVVDSYYNISI